MESVGLLPTVTVPTRITERSATLLDNIFINCAAEEYYTRVIYSDISDHLPVLLNVKFNSFKNVQPINQAPSNYFMSEKNFTKFKSSVAREDWDSLMNTYLNLMSPDQAYDNFLSCFKIFLTNGSWLLRTQMLPPGKQKL